MKPAFLAIFFALILNFCLFHTGNALSATKPCSKGEIIFARGSGDTGGARDDETKRYIDQIKSRINTDTSINDYALGSESYNGFQYPHVAVGIEHLATIAGADISSGKAFQYGKSVLQGKLELETYIIHRYFQCKSSGSYFILGGYSQGAQVIGDALPYLPLEIRSRIIYVGLFGDPKLHYPEGEGFLLPPACFGTRSTYRRGPIVDCHQYQGSLDARRPYLPDDMLNRTNVWCYKDDFICGATSNPFITSGHGTYKNRGLAIDQAAQGAASSLLYAIQNEPLHPSPSPSPSPTPKPDYDNLIDITHHYGEGLTGQNTVFLIDISDANKPNFPQIVSYLDKATHAMEAKGQLFGIGVYGGAPYGPNSITATGIYPLGYGNADYQMSQLRQFIDLRSGFGSWPYFRGSVFDGITQTLPYYGWQGGVNKSLVIFSNAPTLNGAVTTQASLALVIKASLAIDPVNIYPVVPQDTVSLYQDLANLTAGQTFSYDETDPNGIEQAGDTALEAIESKPVALLGSTGYIASPGQEVTFDASDSYALNGTIIEYAWDFDGDGIFETTTAAPTTSYTYTNQFDGYIQVRVTDSNGSYGNASAPVKAGTYTPPARQKAPTNLTATVIASKNNSDTVQLKWDPANDSPAQQVLSVNGIILGSMAPNQTSINVTDIERTEDVIFSVASMSSNSEIGEEASVILMKLQTPFNTILSAAVSDTGISRAALASAKETSTFGLPSTNPITFGSINNASPISAYSYNNDPQHASDMGQSLRFIIPGLLFIAIGTVWGVIRFRRHS